MKRRSLPNHLRELAFELNPEDRQQALRHKTPLNKEKAAVRRSLVVFISVAIVLVAATAFAQDGGTIVKPPSSVGLPGLKVHTPLLVWKPDGVIQNAQNPPANAENPISLACIYGITAPTTGCPKSGAPVATGGSKAIAVVDYGHNSTLQSYFNTFNTQYGLPQQSLIFQCACGSCPSSDGTGWDLETALDVEYAHAMAPNAQIIVSEFCNDPLDDGSELGPAQYIATNYGAGQVSNSWGYNGGEFSDEKTLDHFFVQAGIVFFASAGDDGLGPQYPSVSPNVVSVGGTQVMRDSNGLFTTEGCWNGSGGGISQFEPAQHYQLYIGNKTGPHRGTPDWSADAAVASGAAVYTTTACSGWCRVGGTSLASPLLAGITNAAGNFETSTVRELSKTYQYYVRPTTYHTAFFDVVSGSNGSPAGPGWDQCTGLGSPRKPSFF
jgi:kumamolisin